MEPNEIITLPHLTNDIVIGARKTKLCAYAVALEGWRRGLKLKWYSIDSGKFDNMITFGVNPPGRLFSLSSIDKTHYFFRTRGDKVSNEAVEIGADKDLTKQWLAKVNVPVPNGASFNENITDKEIMVYASQLTYPLVLKPTNGSLGNGVVTNIKDSAVLQQALTYVRNELGYSEVIVEQYVKGDEYRVYVVENEVIAAYNRLPASITSDGVNSIQKLIELKNMERKRNARLHSCLIEIDSELLNYVHELGYTLESVPDKGEQIMLREKTNVSAGGDPIDVTDELPQKIKEIAIQAVNAIPGLYHAGVDIIVDTVGGKILNAVVIELNPTAQIGGILFPVKGKSRDIPSAIIDYYFPETKEKRTLNRRMYFDLNTILEPLQSRTAVEVEVAPAPLKKVFAKKYMTFGSVSKSSYHNWLKNEALKKGLYGYIKVVTEETIEIVVAGEEKEQVEHFQKTIMECPQSSTITKVIPESQSNPIKIGFEIHEGVKFGKIPTTLKKMESEMKRVNKEKYKIDKEIVKLRESKYWKLLSPFIKMEEKFVDTVKSALKKFYRTTLQK